MTASQIILYETEFSVVFYMVTTVHEFSSKDCNKLNNQQMTTIGQQHRLTFLARSVCFLCKIRPGIRQTPTHIVKVKALFLSNDK
jgi:hypothetical protein